MAPATPFNGAEITEKARRDLLLLLEGVRPTHPLNHESIMNQSNENAAR